MKFKTLFKTITVRVVSFILFALISASVFGLASGMIKNPLSTGEKPPVPDLSGPESTLKELEPGDTVSGIGPGTSIPDDSGTGDEQSGSDSNPADSSAAPGLTDDSTPAGSSEASSSGSGTSQGQSGSEPPPSVSALASKGYTLSWAGWRDGFRLASVEFEDGPVPGSAFESGSNKKVTERVPLTYEVGGIEFLSYATRSVPRQSAEVYMGYIIVYAGKTTATGLFPETEVITVSPEPDTTPGEETAGPSAADTLPDTLSETGSPSAPAGDETGASAGETPGENPETSAPAAKTETVILRGQRESIPNVESVAIYSSAGRLIGIYPADSVNPAYTRDNDDRALFTFDGKYYYIDDETGDFTESDYNDETDNRGLYFDYAPDWGTSDNGYKKWSVTETITFTNWIDRTLVYARFAVDWRIARALYEVDPELADYVGMLWWLDKSYYNLPFRAALLEAKKQIAEESREAEKTATQPPVTTDPEPVTGTEAPPETLPGPEDITLPDTLPQDPGTTGAPADTGTSDPSTGEASSLDAAPTGEDVSVTEPATESPSSESDLTTQSPETPSEPLTGETVPGPEATVETTDTGTGTETGTEPTSEDSSEETSEETTEWRYTTAEMTFPAYRYAYGKTQPAVNPDKVLKTNTVISSYYEKTFSWTSGYPYAKAYNFSEGLAVTVDDNGIIRVVNIYDGTVIRREAVYYPQDLNMGEHVFSVYIEPFYRDIYELGSFYYDNGLLRVRLVESLYYNRNTYLTDEERLIDKRGNVYDIPAGFSLVAYSEGILILERNGLYGCYHKDGYWIAQPMYTSALPFVEGLCVLGLSDGTKGMIDTSGKIVLPFRYSDISAPSSGIISCFSEADGWQFFAKMKK
ncbi:MAG: WG repeat-containing protein [Clostridiales bacterium]|nr:WG repeat-containing protein [Clostridiales bacterium]